MNTRLMGSKCCKSWSKCPLNTAPLMDFLTLALAKKKKLCNVPVKNMVDFAGFFASKDEKRWKNHQPVLLLIYVEIAMINPYIEHDWKKKNRQLKCFTLMKFKGGHVFLRGGGWIWMIGSLRNMSYQKNVQCNTKMNSLELGAEMNGCFRINWLSFRTGCQNRVWTCLEPGLINVPQWEAQR